MTGADRDEERGGFTDQAVVPPRDLPSGWIEKIDPSGDVYYFNEITEQSSSEVPQQGEVTVSVMEDEMPFDQDEILRQFNAALVSPSFFVISASFLPLIVPDH